MVSGEGESVVLPEAVADELRANVQADAGVRGTDREPHRPDERVLGPLRHHRRRRRRQKRNQEGVRRHRQDRQRH